MTPIEALVTARWLAAHHAPYLSRILFGLAFVEEPTGALRTIAVDSHLRVYYHQPYVNKCAAEGTLGGEVMHEAVHILMRHLQRALPIGASAAPDYWAGCIDAEGDQRIEEIIAAQAPSQFRRLTLVADRVTPETLGAPRGLTAEEYFLRRPPSPPPKDGRGQGSGGHGSGKAQPGAGKPPPGACGGGSGAGLPQPWELPSGPATPAGAPVGLSEAEVALVIAQTAQDVLRHHQQGRGYVPAGIMRWAEGFFEAAPIDWRLLLSERVRYQLEVRKGTYASYARPSRRRFGRLILPIHRAPVPRIAIVGDTSGSMGTDDIGKIIATVMGAVESLGSVFAIGCDAAATDAVEVRDAESLREALCGGGGTDMGAGIVRALEIDPDAIVVVTDGDTDWPHEEPDAPVIIALTRPCRAPTPAWADVVHAH